MPRIILTGGGTAGHVTPNIALLPLLYKEGFEVSYIGSHEGMERKLIEDQNVPYDHISTGKLRRYRSLKNLTDPFRVIKGFFDAVGILKKRKPDVIFSKGGFVSVPVIWAAALLGIPSIIHESDITPGLANRISIPFAKYVCCNFPETQKYLPKGKLKLTGTPIRDMLLKGDASKGRSFCGFEDNKRPVILVEGGSLGALAVNKAVRDALPELLEDFYVVHLCGKGKMDESLMDTAGYVQFEYVDKEMGDILAMADVIISRAGANAICEFVALEKPALLIPLSADASRGDQIKNAASFEARGFSKTLLEENVTKEALLEGVRYLYENRQSFKENMSKAHEGNPEDIIVKLIKDNVR